MSVILSSEKFCFLPLTYFLASDELKKLKSAENNQENSQENI